MGVVKVILRRIGWTNFEEPAISAENLSKMEDNIEELIDEAVKTNIITGQPSRTGRIVNDREEFELRLALGTLVPGGRIVPTGLNHANITITDLYGIARHTGGATINLPFVSVAAIGNGIELQTSGNNIVVTPGIDRSAWTGTAIMRYTQN